jgi:predicted subunit of tRNA(5-methylaminomethyl-2-thiouridylate) methyltransferase
MMVFHFVVGGPAARKAAKRKQLHLKGIQISDTVISSAVNVLLQRPLERRTDRFVLHDNAVGYLCVCVSVCVCWGVSVL